MYYGAKKEIPTKVTGGATVLYLRVLIILLTLVVAGCPGNSDVTIPSPGQDKAPVITINAFVPGDKCKINPANVSITSSVYALWGCTFVLTGSAKNPGGVKTLAVMVWQNGRAIYQATNTNVPDASGKVSPNISIPGVNGSGGIGSTAMSITVSGDTPGINHTSPALMQASATNFNNQSTSINVTYGGTLCRNPPGGSCLYCQGGACDAKPTPPGCYWSACTQ